jgi:threonine dehydrogenase-like Zn-dependent dehydrogenase
MKCTILESGKLAVEKSDIPNATSGYCLFEVKASGICGSDLPYRSMKVS